MNKIKLLIPSTTTTILLLLLVTLFFSACTKESPRITIASLKGPTGMGMVKVMEDHKQENDPYQFVLSGAPDELVGKIVNKEIDIACVPTNLAAVLYNKTGGSIQLAAVNTLGVLYVLENGTTINTISDLKGKTIYVSGKGATPDYVFRYLLIQNGIDPDEDIDINFSLQHADLATALAAGEIDLALLPQPFVTTVQMKNPNINIALDLNKEWQDISPTSDALNMGCIIVQKDFADNYPKEFEAFLEEYQASVNWVNENASDASILIQAHDIIPNAKLAEMAIPKSNMVYIKASTVSNELDEYFKILFEYDATSVGGKLPDENIFYKKK